MHRFFVEPHDINDGEAIIKGPDVKHITRVLRLKKGDLVMIANGEGLEYEGELKEEREGSLIFSLLTSSPTSQESPLLIHLYQALIRSHSFEIVIQKTTELGVFSIHPFVTQRSLIPKSGAGKERKKERWQRIAIEAAKQSQRGKVPVIGEVLDFQEALKASQGTERIIPTLLKKYRRVGLAPLSIKEISLFIGPEGGFTPFELEMALVEGATAVSLGPRILRSETAAMASVAILNYFYGDGGKGDG